MLQTSRGSFLFQEKTCVRQDHGPWGTWRDPKITKWESQHKSEPFPHGNLNTNESLSQLGHDGALQIYNHLEICVFPNTWIRLVTQTCQITCFAEHLKRSNGSWEHFHKTDSNKTRKGLSEPTTPTFGVELLQSRWRAEKMIPARSMGVYSHIYIIYRTI